MGARSRQVIRKEKRGTTFELAPAVLGSTALIAAVVPAWRAARIAPAVALRHDSQTIPVRRERDTVVA